MTALLVGGIAGLVAAALAVGSLAVGITLGQRAEQAAARHARAAQVEGWAQLAESSPAWRRFSVN